MARGFFQLTQEWQNEWTNTSHLKVAYLFCSVLSTIQIVKDEYNYLLVCYYIVSTLTEYPIAWNLISPHMVGSTFNKIFCTVLAITPPVIDLVFPNLPAYFDNPQNESEVKNCNFILDNAFNGIFAPGGLLLP